MAEVSQSAVPCLYFWTAFYLLTYLKINSYYVMNNSISLKHILVAYWTLIHIQIYTSEVYTSAAEKSFDLYFLEDRIFHLWKVRKKWDNKILCSVCESKRRNVLQY